MSSPLTYFDKIWNDHLIKMLGDDMALLQIDRLMLHELGGSQTIHALTNTGRKPNSREQVFVVIEHLISTRPGRTRTESCSSSGPIMIQTTRQASRSYGLHFIDYDDERQGIIHVIAPELGISLPGTTHVCCDSHTCTVGGIGALAWGIGTSEAEHVLATQTIGQTKPKTMRVSFEGSLKPGVYAKDMILALIGRVGANGGIGYAAEFAGSAIRSLPVNGRLTLCNMAIEFQAKYGFVPADDVTFEYLAGRDFVPKRAAWDQAVAHWRALATDPGASFDREVTIDCTDLQPQVTWGISPQQVTSVDGYVPDPLQAVDSEERQLAERAIAYMQLSPGTRLQDVPIDVAYIGSCTNARLSDLRVAASVLKGRKIKLGIQALCIPGSTPVKRAAEAEGLDKIFRDAGFEWRESACGFCGHIGDDRFENLRVISTTNRNFVGRQGPQTRTHLASPATVAASAVEGRIFDARRLAG